MWWVFRDKNLHSKVDHLTTLVQQLVERSNQMAVSFNDLKAKVQEMADVEASLLEAFNGIIERLRNAPTEADIAEVIAALETEKQEMAAAILNVPA